MGIEIDRRNGNRNRYRKEMGLKYKREKMGILIDAGKKWG